MSEITFGTDGWRAIIAEQFTFENVAKAAYAMGEYIRNTYHTENNSDKVPTLIGYDTRFLADKFALHAAKTLVAMGIPTKIVNRDVPTPAIAWSTQIEPTAGALQFTASHNPPEYCGMKYIPHFAGPATNEITDKIVSYLDKVPNKIEIANVDIPTFDPRAPYLAALKSRINFDLIGKSGLKIAYDSNYSTSRDYIDKLLIDCGLGCAVYHNWRDPLFGGNMPEPKPEYLKELIKHVKEERFDIGLATDGDADRFGIIDNTGSYLSPNQLLCLVARHLLKNRNLKGAIVRTVATTHLLDLLAKKHGLEVIETPVGFKYIGELMRVKDVLIGGEESGGISIKGHIPEKDGILGNMLIVEMLATEKKSLSSIWLEFQKEVGASFAYGRDDLHLNKDTLCLLMKALKSNVINEIAGLKVTKVGQLDGFKFYFDDNNWLLVRPSGTEPLTRLYCEGDNQEKVQYILSDFKKQIESILAKKGNQTLSVLKS